MPLNYPLKAVFFDLDGTLLDTAADLAGACNLVLQQYQRPPIPFATFREWVHGGASMMVCNSFQIASTHPDFSAIKSAFLANYRECLTQKTCLFTGIDSTLAYLDQHHILWGIVTNKPQQLTQPLADYFQFTARCCCIISGDTLQNTKPHPEPLLHACALAHISPQHSVYVGDTLSDIQAAQAAGMQSIAVGYGYRPKQSNIEDWPADALASTPQDLLQLLQYS